MSRRSKKQQRKPAPSAPPPAAIPPPQVSPPAASKPPSKAWQIPAICALLAILVLLAFGQTAGHGFVNYDDDDYVYENPVVSKGLSAAGIGWAFTHVHAYNWHPLTTISHMLDCQLYGLQAGGHHLTSVLLQAICAVLLFLMLLEMTGALWRGAFVAALFAIHPLRVESVAWIAERKDLLSGIFFMLTLHAYARYARRPSSPVRYVMVALWLALGLLSKPMLVTTPFVLLLLDYWPLARLREKADLPRLLWEKLPLFALSAASCAATVIAQKQAIQPIARFPLSLRLGNALVACCVYLGKLIWPVRLAVLYPIPKNGWPPWQVGAALLLLISLTCGAFLLRRKRPFLAMGWLWYLGMLVPVIGILQVGYQAYADRYTYLPEIGLCIAGTWFAADWARERRYPRPLLAGAASIYLSVLLLATWRQTTWWRDSKSLWVHTIDCTNDNAIAHDNLGGTLLEQGRPDEAIAQIRDALRIDPAYSLAHYDLGVALLGQNQVQEAITHLREALRLDPAYAPAHYKLGLALLQQGKTGEAIDQFHEAVRLNPAYAEAHCNLGLALFGQGRAGEGIAEMDRALELQPANSDLQNNLALMLVSAPEPALRNGPRALELATKASQASGGNDPGILDTMAAAYAETGRFPEAIQTATKALALAQAQSNTSLAAALARDIKLYQSARPR